ncbi:MAG: hypothetical protein B6I25_03970 [Planctomycetales bacterium 4572_13]|nr:MAG: hypothetical protein B6I25_03970 [Planctomycetales bacterium 4572_13]
MATRDNKRALKVIRSLHSSRQKQVGQIDVLCRDMVSAHREFSTKLATVNFVTSYYESLLGCTGLDDLLDTAVRCIRESVKEADAAVFLLSENGFDVHMADTGVADPVEKRQFQHWFTPEVVQSISQMNRICSLEQLLRMGLQGSPAVLKTISLVAIPISLVAIPLGRFGQAVGFILVYRPAHRPLRPEELSPLAAISVGLRQAIGSFQRTPSSHSIHPR